MPRLVLPKGAMSCMLVAAAVIINHASAFWVLGCGKPVVVERLDPIVSPGTVSGHVHTVMGGNAFTSNMTYETTQTSQCTTCGVTKDLSNYWVPTVYFQAANGSFVSVEQVGGINIYYQQRIDHTEIRAGKKIHAFPKGFRMLAGNPLLRSYNPHSLEQRAIEFVCLLTNGEKGLPPFPGFPNRTCDGGLQIRIRFPCCWDGQNLDSADHKSHMAYPSMVDNGVCPDTHPVRLISLFYEMTWSVTAFNHLREPGDQPFVFSFGDPTGFGYHGDFVNGWDADLLNDAIYDSSCGDSAGGRINLCDTFKPYLQDAKIQNECPGITSEVVEQVAGVLPALPGCNPVQNGPQDATMPDCSPR
ncbi:hypothetical protein GQ53DRAFT_271453 [Thozetella sp. PMI_491]|nr:hypothetical protein GQ53DRAFT_271453 [Thozetella sp. PMI_491]